MSLKKALQKKLQKKVSRALDDFWNNLPKDYPYLVKVGNTLYPSKTIPEANGNDYITFNTADIVKLLSLKFRQ